MSDELQVAAAEVWPPIKTAWLDIQCWPDQTTPSLMRLVIEFEVNGGEKTKTMVNALIDPVPGNGVICEGHNLTWLIHQSAELDRYKSALTVCKGQRNWEIEHAHSESAFDDIVSEYDAEIQSILDATK